MCDGAGDPCDSLCGGAGCGKCGGLSCEDGAATKASNALSVAQDASEILDKRERQVDELLRGVSTGRVRSEEVWVECKGVVIGWQRLQGCLESKE